MHRRIELLSEMFYQIGKKNPRYCDVTVFTYMIVKNRVFVKLLQLCDRKFSLLNEYDMGTKPLYI